MIIDCSNFRNLIPRALLSDLTRVEQEALEAHLKDCAPCAQERELYLNTFSQLRSADDAPVPRHFFIYPDESRPTLRQLFGQLLFLGADERESSGFQSERGFANHEHDDFDFLSRPAHQSMEPRGGDVWLGRIAHLHQRGSGCENQRAEQHFPGKRGPGHRRFAESDRFLPDRFRFSVHRID